ncbi:MAG: hypothetical protein ACLU2L_03445, partial [Fenollaria timonensis]
MKKIFSILLIAVMMISSLSVNIFAKNGGSTPPIQNEQTQPGGQTPPGGQTTPTPIVEDDLFLVSTSTEEVKPGDETTIYFVQDSPRYYRPDYDYEVYSVRASSDNSNNCYVINSYGGFNGAEVRIRIPENAEAGTYRISLVGKAKRRGDENAAPVKVEGEAYVRVKEGSQRKA